MFTHKGTKLKLHIVTAVACTRESAVLSMRKTSLHLQGAGLVRRGKTSTPSRGTGQADVSAGGRCISGRGPGVRRVYVLKNALQQGAGTEEEGRELNL